MLFYFERGKKMEFLSGILNQGMRRRIPRRGTLTGSGSAGPLPERW